MCIDLIIFDIRHSSPSLLYYFDDLCALHCFETNFFLSFSKSPILISKTPVMFHDTHFFRFWLFFSMHVASPKFLRSLQFINYKIKCSRFLGFVVFYFFSDYSHAYGSIFSISSDTLSKIMFKKTHIRQQTLLISHPKRKIRGVTKLPPSSFGSNCY